MATLLDRYIRDKVRETAQLGAKLSETERRAEKAERIAKKRGGIARQLHEIKGKLDSRQTVKDKQSATAKLTVNEAAAALDVDPRTIRRYLESGRLRFSRLGTSERAPIRIQKSDLDALLTSGKSEKQRAVEIVRTIIAKR